MKSASICGSSSCLSISALYYKGLWGITQDNGIKHGTFQKCFLTFVKYPACFPLGQKHSLFPALLKYTYAGNLARGVDLSKSFDRMEHFYYQLNQKVCENWNLFH